MNKFFKCRELATNGGVNVNYFICILQFVLNGDIAVCNEI